ncbi:MAG: type IV pilin [Thermoplasmata archaeon]|nr:type IV pilin [Thermoplasmata archaeon]
MDMWKKMWKNDEAVSPVIAVILMVAITVVLAAVLYVWAQSFTTGQDQALTIGWNQEVVGDNYRIDIISVDTIGTDEVAFSLLNPQYAPVAVDNGLGEDIRFSEIDLDIVKYVEGDFDDAETDPILMTWDETFYEQDDGANETAYVIFMDVNDDDKVNSGDVIWIRSAENDGAADEDYHFRLINKQQDKAYGTLDLSAT